MKVLITGANGFIGKNLQLYLRENSNFSTVLFTHSDSINTLKDLLSEVDFVFHLAGVNRPSFEKEFTVGNIELTQFLCTCIKQTNRRIPILYASSTQATRSNPYGMSKLAAENSLRDFSLETKTPVYIFRLPNVFGKFSRPNYNSVVATFCYNISRNLDIQIHDESALLNLVYIDDVIQAFLSVLTTNSLSDLPFYEVKPVYTLTLKELADKLLRFKNSRSSLITERVGEGLDRALYSTYLSFLDPSDFQYSLTHHQDSRGVFVEMLRTRDSGQFSFFSACPGVTRGGHYHHTKTEKFFIVQGEALFRFYNVSSGDSYEIKTTESQYSIVETVPGWAHDITNIGSTTLIVLLWANEVFDPNAPDTYHYPFTSAEGKK